MTESLAVAKDPEKPVDAAVNQLDKQVARTASLFADLSAQLAPVRASTPEANAVTPREVPGGSPLVQRLDAIIGAVLDLQERVQVLMGELEV